jgi:hypothetical protein
VDADDGRQQLSDAGQFAAQAFVVDGNDVVAKFADARSAPVALLDGVRGLFAPLQGGQQPLDGADVEPARRAGVPKAL